MFLVFAAQYEAALVIELATRAAVAPCICSPFRLLGFGISTTPLSTTAHTDDEKDRAHAFLDSDFHRFAKYNVPTRETPDIVRYDPVHASAWSNDRRNHHD